MNYLVMHSFNFGAVLGYVAANFTRFSHDVAVKIISMALAALDPATPDWARVIFAAAILYVLNPVDFIPDILPGGLVDDIAAIVAALTGVAGVFITDAHRSRAEAIVRGFSGHTA